MTDKIKVDIQGTQFEIPSIPSMKLPQLALNVSIKLDNEGEISYTDKSSKILAIHIRNVLYQALIDEFHNFDTNEFIEFQKMMKVREYPLEEFVKGMKTEYECEHESNITRKSTLDDFIENSLEKYSLLKTVFFNNELLEKAIRYITQINITVIKHLAQNIASDPKYENLKHEHDKNIYGENFEFIYEFMKNTWDITTSQFVQNITFDKK